jgi:hypothetical protein
MDDGSSPQRQLNPSPPESSVAMAMPTSHLACRQGSPLVWLKDQSQLAGAGGFGTARSDLPFHAQTLAGVAGQA